MLKRRGIYLHGTLLHWGLEVRFALTLKAKGYLGYSLEGGLVSFMKIRFTSNRLISPTLMPSIQKTRTQNDERPIHLLSIDRLQQSSILWNSANKPCVGKSRPLWNPVLVQQIKYDNENDTSYSHLHLMQRAAKPRGLMRDNQTSDHSPFLK